MSTRTIYLVWADAGEYDDRFEYCVKAYSEQAKTEDHVARAEARAKVLMEWRDADGQSWANSPDPNKPKNEYDPGMRVINGEPPRYYVYETELDDSV